MKGLIKYSDLKIDNRENLILVSKLLTGIEYFIFFGTILGLTRERDIIDHDDDIDILVPIELKSFVIEKLIAVDLFKINKLKSCNQSNYFLQIDSSINDRQSFVDLYFYQKNIHENFIVDRWNFFGNWKDPNFELHIPKILIFPILKQEFFGHIINVPACGELVCEWLYGEDWRIPKKKGINYKVRLIQNRPILVKPIPRFIERLIPRHLRVIIERFFYGNRPLEPKG
jgi:hypothetical protein